MIVINEIETRRFGVVCARLHPGPVSGASLKEVHEDAKNKGVGMIAARIDVSALDQVHALEQAGYKLMDTLVWYGRRLSDAVAKSMATTSNIRLRLSEPCDADTVEAIASRAFANYFGHYHADPRLSRTAADAAYVEWARTSVAAATDLSPVLLAIEEEIVAGFATMRLNLSDEAEIVLNAVEPLRQGRGIYSALVKGALGQAETLGAKRIIISTQINNYPVQRVWSRLGFVHERSLYTFHKWL